MLGLLIAFAAIGTALVAIRLDEARVSRGIQQLHYQKVELERETWAQQMELARLRAPGLVRERAERMKPQSVPEKPPTRSTARAR